MAVNHGRGMDINAGRHKMNLSGSCCSANYEKCGEYSDYPENKPPECIPFSSEKKSKSSLIDELLGENPDTEKLMIAALIFLLLKEKADMKLILALGYILL